MTDPEAETPEVRTVLAMGCEDAEPAVRALGLRFATATTWEACRDRIHDPDVRALVLRGEDGALLSESVGRARQEAPLVDVLVWAPNGSGEDVRLALQQGAADVILGHAPERLAKAVHRTVERQKFLPRLQRFQAARAGQLRFEGMISKSKRMWELFETVVQIAPSGAAVVILGETGVGKELLARAIHTYSGREGRFVAVNCGAIPENLVDTELFGHEEGTFTGATRNKAGLFRSADGGTLFLDEIGSLPLTSQYSFLRALQEEAVRPIGGHHEIPVDVRVIAATSDDLDEEARRGFFREDLLFRLDVIRLVVPPLRERPEDVLHLFGHFRRKLAKHYRLEPPSPTDSFLEALLAYEWPGNVRELENVTERLVLTHHGKSISQRQFETLKRPYRKRPVRHEPKSVSERLKPPAKREGPSFDTSKTLKANVEQTIDELERRYLIEVMEKNAGRVAETARTAGISPRTLLRKMKRHGIDKHQFRG
ncbi:MAG: sigma-54-dependent Fis family transcriptional regulator [Planctomycetes bacterium]|nr:sigma-54-dependent Fis family transcriptional regulator [Planctomycetota bacterium]